MRYTAVSRSLWHSRKFRQLADFEKVLYLYLLTNEAVTPIGVYRFQPITALWDLDRRESDLGVLEQALERLKVIDLIEHDPHERLLRLVNFITFCPPCNPKHAAFLCKEAAHLPPCSIKANVINELSRFEKIRNCREIGRLLGNGIDTVSVAEPGNGIDTVCVPSEPVDNSKKGYGIDTVSLARGKTLTHTHTLTPKKFYKKINNKKDGPAGTAHPVAHAAKPTRRAGTPKTVGEHLAGALAELRKRKQPAGESP